MCVCYFVGGFTQLMLMMLGSGGLPPPPFSAPYASPTKLNFVGLDLYVQISGGCTVCTDGGLTQLMLMMLGSGGLLPPFFRPVCKSNEIKFRWT